MNKDQYTLFQTQVINDQGMNGVARVTREDGLRVITSSPLATHVPGTNPEELIGLSWSTCLNATIEYALRRHDYKNVHSEVLVNVQYRKREDGSKTYFVLEGIATVDLPQDEAEKIVEEAHSRCPVSQIIGDYEYMTLKVIGKTE